MGQFPWTRIEVGAAREADIRAAVRGTRELPSTAASSRLATSEDAAALTELFAFPEVNRWIYSLPRPLTEEAVAKYITSMKAARERGEGLLSLNFDEVGVLSGYSELCVWPQWGAGELAGAMRPDLQSKGQGGAGMITTFTWMFKTLGLDLICNTTASDNVRIQKLFQRTGFVHRGDIESQRPDGTIRQSQVWEIMRDDWLAGQAG